MHLSRALHAVFTHAVTGWLKSSQTDSPLFDGRWDAEAGKVTFAYDYPHAGRLDVQATVKDGKIAGTIGDSAEFEGTLDEE